MQKKAKFVIPMLTTFIQPALANLPDEINYAPYQRTYEQTSAQVDILQASLNTAQNELDSAYTKEADLSEQISRLELNIARTNSQINNHIDERDRLLTHSEGLDREMRQVENKLARLEQRRTKFEREVTRETRRLQPFKQELKRLQKELGEANKRVTAANKKLKKLEAVKNKKKQAYNSAKTKVDDLKSTLKTQQDTLKNIKKLISNAQARVTNLTTQKQTASSEKAAAQTSLDAINAEMAVLQEQLRQHNPRTEQGREIMRQIKEKKPAQKAAANKVSKANKKLQSVSKKLKSAEAELAKLKRQETALPNTIAATRKKLQAAKTARDNAQDAYHTALESYDVQDAVTTNLVSEANLKSAEVNQQKEEIIRRSAPLNEAMANLERVNDRIRNVGSKLAQLSNEYNTTMDKIEHLDDEIPRLRRHSQNMNRSLRTANSDLMIVQDQIVALNGDVTRLSSDLRQTTVQRDLEYQEYISRYDYYMEKLSDAKMLGSSQTDIAMTIATDDSNILAAQTANTLGEKMGKDVASAQANYWSAIRAEIKGHDDGYNEGYASESDQLRGEQEGTRAGINAARDYANTTLKPQYFNEYYATALTTGVFKSLEISEYNQSSNKDLERESITKNILEYFSQATPVTDSEIMQSQDITTDLDTSIATYAQNLSQVYYQETNYGKAQNTYQAPQTIPYQSYDCENVYKAIREFKNACAAEYKRVFGNKYMQEHQENYNTKYPQQYTDVVSKTRSEAIDELYTAGYEQFYPIAKAQGVSDGQDQIYKETYAIAKDRAYNEELPKADMVAKAQASNEVKDWVANNAALTVTGSKIMAADLRGGYAAKVNLNLKNISPKDLITPVEVVITRATNANMSASRYYVKSAKGSTTTSFNGIDFRISDNARGGSQITISGIVKVPGGKYQAERQESFTVNAIAEVNPRLTYEGLNYDNTPKVKGAFRYYIHAFRPTISAAVENINSGYTVTLTPQADSASYIKMKNTSINTGALGYNTSKQLQFNYSFPKAARGRTIKLDLKYIYQGRVMKSQTIELRPH